MVLSMLLAITTAPALLGSQEAIRQSQSKNRREEHRAQRCNLMVHCLSPSSRSHEINGKTVVLKGSKLFVDTGNIPDFNGSGEPPHKFCGYFLQYPDADYEGLVSTITGVAPILNWIYVDRATYEVKYGVRDSAQPQLTGPFDCTREDRRLTLEGWEGFVAVEVVPEVWALYYDRDDNGLRDKLPPGARVLEVELARREKKMEKPAADAEQPSLDEMLERQKRKRAEEAADRARQQQGASEGRPLDEGEDKRAPLAREGRIPEEQAAERASQDNARSDHEKGAWEVPAAAEQTRSTQPSLPPPPSAAAEVEVAAGRAEAPPSDDGAAKQTSEGSRALGQQA